MPDRSARDDNAEQPHLTLVADNPAPAPDARLTSVDEARESLQAVAEGQKALAGLAERIAALEVECIEADLAASQSASAHGISPQDAVKLGTLFARQRTLENAFGELDNKPAADDDDSLLNQLRTGIEALEIWLNAPKVRESTRTATLARVVLLMAVIICGFFAWILHWAVLLLLIPVAGPISAMLQRGENTQWRRAGMKQRFEQCGLRATHAWDEAGVEAMLAALRQRLAEAEKRSKRQPLTVDPDAADERYAELSYEQVDLELAMERMRADCGLDPETLSAAERDALVRMAQLASARRSLESVEKQREALKKSVEQRKDGIFRLLSGAGLAPAGGRADVATLSAGLAELEHRQN